jgi:hypothetical protein
MKFLKKSQINPRNVKDDSVAVQYDGEVTMDTPKSLLLPKGTQANRPVTPTNGLIRYNTDTNQLEGYQAGAWRRIAFQQPKNLSFQDLGTGDSVEVYFGPLNSGLAEDNTTYGDYSKPALDKPQDILVFIENVPQLPTLDGTTRNYTLEDDPAGFAAGRYIKFDSAVPFGKNVTVLHGINQ